MSAWLHLRFMLAIAFALLAWPAFAGKKLLHPEDTFSVTSPERLGVFQDLFHLLASNSWVALLKNN